MSLSALEIADVLPELDGAFTGHPLRHVHQLDETTILLSTARSILCVSCHPRASRIHRVDTTKGRIPVQDFALHLRRRLIGARFAGFEQPPGERLVRLLFEAADGAPILCAELTGRHGNLLLLEGDTIAGSLVPNRSRKRLLVPGQPYTPMFPRTAPPFEQSRFEGQPSTAIAEHYAPQLQRWKRDDLLRDLLSPLKRDLKARRKLVKRLEADRSKHDSRLGDQRLGDLLLAQPKQLPKGQEQIELVDLFAQPTPDGQPTITVSLNPRLTGAQNAQTYYRRASKARRGITAIDARLPAVHAEIERLEATLLEVKSADDSALAALVKRVAPAPATKKQRRRDARQGKRNSSHRQFVARGGETLWVGRSATDNDRLTFTTARGRDVWLHARDVTGAHVVLRLEGKGEPPHESLLDAACLAKHYSDARNALHADVTWTRVKHVRRSNTPGQVYLADARTLRVSADDERLGRLFSGGSTSARISDGLEDSGSRSD